MSATKNQNLAFSAGMNARKRQYIQFIQKKSVTELEELIEHDRKHAENLQICLDRYPNDSGFEQAMLDYTKWQIEQKEFEIAIRRGRSILLGK
jgi:hypothetical protein